MQRKLLIVAGVVFLAAVSWIFYTKLTEKEIVPLTKSWEKVVQHQEIPEGLVSLNAEDCGTCHQSHYEEWKISTHAHAWTDMQFQAELKKESSPFLCINCHIPLQNQQEFIVSGLVDGDIYQPVKTKNPNFDRKLQQEGINCASCHVRDGKIIGTLGSTLAPHPVKKDPQFLNETLCIGCHNANAVVTPTLACTFETGDEWKAGPYYPEKNCISCHMENVERPLVAGFEPRDSHRHWFAGSGIPKRVGVEAKGLDGMAFYPSKIQRRVKKGQELNYSLKLKNEFAGHRLPSGDPERFYLIIMELKNAKGEIVARDSSRIGEQWEWYPEAKKLSDNNMNPKEERSYSLSYIPKVNEKLKLNVRVTKHRMDEATAAYNKLTAAYPLLITVFEENHEIEVI
ncbi:Cytochrome c554 and c-prime [Spirosomataceae bacterium TFI 002]|nr:Cytochrome c554 and c-prime [Spirosomataceae bacterium TFI 002]